MFAAIHKYVDEMIRGTIVFWNAVLLCVELNDTCGNNASYYMHIFTANHKITARITLHTARTCKYT